MFNLVRQPELIGGTPTDLAILLVEDNPGDIRLVQEMLAEVSRQTNGTLSCSLSEATNLTQAEEQLDQREYDLALVDLSLPDANGLDTVHRLRKVRQDLPLVVLTGNRDRELAMAAIQAGAQDYLVKGQFKGATLLRAIRYAIERQRFAERLHWQREFSRTILSSLDSNIAVLGADGEILDTNEAWDRFALAHEVDPEAVGRGRNYLEVCRRSFKRGDEHAGRALHGIDSVLSGEATSFRMEYPCPAEDEDRWCVLKVVPFEGRDAGVVVVHEDITERRVAQAQVLEQREQIRSLLDNAPDIIARYDLQGRHVYVNQAVEAVTGLPPEHYLGRTNPELNLVEGRGELWQCEIKAAIDSGTARTFEFEVAGPDGRHTFETRLVPEQDHQGELKSVLAISREISDLVQAEEDLKRREAHFRSLIEGVSDLITLIDLEGRITYVSPSVERILGYSADQVLDEPVFSFLHEDDIPLAAEILRAYELGQDPSEFVELRLQREDGTWAYMSAIGRRYEGEGDPSVIVNARDVSEQHELNEELRRSEERYRMLFERNQAAVFQAGLDGELLEYNRAFVKLFGMSEASPNGDRLSLLDFYDEAKDHQRYIDRLLADGQVNQYGLRMKRADGEPISVLASSVLLEGEGQDRIIQGTMLDVTAQRRAQERIAASERRFRALVQNASDLITLVDEEGIIRYQSPSIRSVLGYEPQDLLGIQVDRLVHPTDVKAFKKSMAKIIEDPGQTANGELRVRRRDGSYRHLEVHATNSLHDPAIGSIVVNARDTTERRRNAIVREAVLRVAASLRTAANRSEMPPIILGELQELLQADSVALVMHDERRNQMVIERGVGAWKQMEGRRLARGDGSCWKVYDQREPLDIPNLADEGAFSDSKYASDEHAGLAVPLIVGDRVMGVIWLARKHRFDAEEIDIVSAVADMAANGLNRATLHEETIRHAEQMARITTLGQEMGQMLDESFIHERLVQVSAEIVPDVSVVLLARYFASEQEFSLAYGLDNGAEIDVSEAPRLKLEPPGHGQQSEVVRSKKPLIVDDFSEIYARHPEARRGDPPYPLSGLYVPLVTRGEVLGVLQLQSLSKGRFTEKDAEIMTLVANTAAVALTNAQLFQETQATTVQLSLAYDSTLEGWAKALELRDQETEGHTRRVAEMTIRLALELGVPADQLTNIRRGALLHDIGKMGIPDEILLKPGPLSEEEWEIMRRHPVYARDMLAEVDYLRPALEIPYYHHERWDGSGYPEGLKGEEIPLCARIFAVVDVHDALSTDRPYREAWPAEKVLEYLRDNAGVLFDPTIAEAFLGLLAKDE